MHDPRIELVGRLEKIGIPDTVAFLLAIDAGSQGIIDREYLSSSGIRRKKMQDRAFFELTKFYAGDYE